MDRETAINNIIRYSAFHYGLHPADLKMRQQPRNIQKTPKDLLIILAKSKAALELKQKLGFSWTFIGKILKISQYSARKYAEEHSQRHGGDGFVVTNI